MANFAQILFDMKNCCLLAVLLLVVSSCGDLIKKPIDAKTRDLIDSIASAQCRQVRIELDTFYNQNHHVLMKKMMDSLTIERRREIAEQIESARFGK